MIAATDDSDCRFSGTLASVMVCSQNGIRVLLRTACVRLEDGLIEITVLCCSIAHINGSSRWPMFHASDSTGKCSPSAYGCMFGFAVLAYSHFTDRAN